MQVNTMFVLRLRYVGRSSNHPPFHFDMNDMMMRTLWVTQNYVEVNFQLQRTPPINMEDTLAVIWIAN